MLQQTQVKTVVPYFNKFIEKYPNLDALLKASEDEILAQWSLSPYTHLTLPTICSV